MPSPRGNATPSQVDSQGVPDSLYTMSSAMQGDNQETANLIYVGFARPGSLATDPVWQIKKLTWDTSGNVIAVEWPSLDEVQKPTNQFKYAWNIRTSYTYS